MGGAAAGVASGFGFGEAFVEAADFGTAFAAGFGFGAAFVEGAVLAAGFAETADLDAPWEPWLMRGECCLGEFFSSKELAWDC